MYQPRVWGIEGNGGKCTQSSEKKHSISPATPCTLSCPPVIRKAATLRRISTLSRIVIWFWMQLRRSAILKYKALATPQRIGVETSTTSAQCTRASYTSVSSSAASICVIEQGQVQAFALFE